MKKRLDQILVERGLAESRARAQALVMAGLVYSGTKRLDKPGHDYEEDTAIEVKGSDHPYVSRGGLKLAAALDHFPIDPKDCICLDVGSSTGGFTDVLLQRDAKKVYAVDVGTNQLAWKLRQDSRVVVMENTNARYLTQELIPEAPSIVTCDASFISLKLVLPVALQLAAAEAWLVALIKPQFEVGKENVGKGGIVRDEALQKQTVDMIHAWLADDMKWRVAGVMESPITGMDGNREFLIAAKKRP